MIEIRETSVYRGPNIWARMPVIVLRVDIGELEQRPTNEIPGFVDALLALLPSLDQHHCSLGYAGGFIERLREGTWLGHVLEHVALELQSLAGAQVTRGKTRMTDEPGVYNVVFQYRQENVGLAAGKLSLRLLNHLVYGAEPDFDFNRELEDQVILLAERLGFGPSTQAILDEAERRGIPVLRLHPSRSLVQLGHGRYQKRIWATLTSSTSDVAVDIAGNKDLANQLLRDAGIPAPRGVMVRSVDEAVRRATEIGYPVVIKPLDGNHGRGVWINLEGEQSVRDCYAASAAESRDSTVIVERFVTGRDYRILVINQSVVAVAERVPACVIGDGVQTVRELVVQENSNPQRGVGHEKVLTRITLDDQSDDALARQSLTLDDVPAAGRVVYLKQTGNMSTGGTAIDRTGEIHPDNIEIALQAAMVVGLDVAGIDVVTPDISQPIWEDGGAIVEINAAPGFRMHTHPTEGTPRPVGSAVIDMMFQQGCPTRVPIVAVTGTNGKTTTTRMIAHIMRRAGHRVGMTTTDGIYVDGAQLARGDMAGPDSARVVLKNPRVDFAVLEAARGGILRSGLGFDRCNVAVVTNVASDHLGLKGIDSLRDLARVKAVVPASVFRDGASVLNADNPWTVEMARDARGEIIFFSMDETSPVIVDHLQEQGRAVVLRQTPQGEMLTLLDRDSRSPIILAHEIPATADGRIRVNIANALAASAAAIASGVSLELIGESLRVFSTGYEQTPGRFNVTTVAGRQVLMDYGHNVDALAAVGDFVRRTNAPRTIGVITVPGDRRDEDVRAFGELAGRIFDRIVIREDADPRGRQPGEVAAALYETVVGTGLSPDRVSVVLDEVAAVHAAIDLANPGDLVVTLVDRVSLVWDSLQERTVNASPERADGNVLAEPGRPSEALPVPVAPARK